ncbi:hypothetical protein B0T22DRAFT_475900 [Podospora appendiculata]|uniref:Uncharacterized protein n=1 Tax=Podospora appendiculata TaxID=314037 RepID=A0AAE0XGY8_9PEZI|nr:hypothetical protein B0T22DRAFT_475900 [Podospora appendiculata]
MDSRPYQSFPGNGAYRPSKQEHSASDSLPTLPSNYNAASDQYYAPAQTDNNGSNTTYSVAENQKPSSLPPIPINYNAGADQYNNASTDGTGQGTYNNNPNITSQPTVLPQEHTNAPDEGRISHGKPPSDPDQDRNDSESEKKKRIGGFSPRALIIIVVVIAAIIAISVGVGVGKSSSSSSSTGGGGSGTKTTTKYTPTIATRTTTTSTARTPTPTPVFLNNQTSPSSTIAFQAFSEAEYLGKATGVMQKTGFYDLGLDCKSFVWLPKGTACCVTLCANRTTAVGAVCDERFEKRVTVTGAAARSFPRVHLWCGDGDPRANVTCS